MTNTNDLTRLAEQFKGRADDCGRLARAILATKPQAVAPVVAVKDREITRLHTLLKMQHAESVELWNALKDLSFECDGVTCVLPPSRETYNRTFAVLQSKLHLSPEALRGYGESGATQQSGGTIRAASNSGGAAS